MCVSVSECRLTLSVSLLLAYFWPTLYPRRDPVALLWIPRDLSLAVNTKLLWVFPPLSWQSCIGSHCVLIEYFMLHGWTAGKN